MSTDLRALDTPTPLDLLVAFWDLTGFWRAQQQRDDAPMFALLDELAERAGDILEPAGGTIVKMIGDAGLVVFPPDRVDDGVLALLRLRQELGGWLETIGLPCRVVVKVHYGALVAGPLGPRSMKRFDVIGTTVSRTALLESRGFAITPEAFRSLSAETRQRFKKHTPPVRYIPVDEPHRD